MKFFDSMISWSKSLVLLFAVLFVFIITFVRVLIGHEFALSFFYLIPISLLSLSIGRSAGISMAFACILCWLLADLSMLSKFSSPYIPYINEFFRLLMFIFVATVLASMRDLLIDQKKTARTDSLTGIPNRFSFLEYAELEISKSRFYRRPISMIYIDIDNFKLVNDKWGHAEGDLVLIKVAAVITNIIRETDFAARLGGDEFGILLWRSSSSDSILLAEKIRKELLNLAARNNWPITYSMGLVTFDEIPESVKTLIDEADNLMYEVKHSGKNALKFKIVS